MSIICADGLDGSDDSFQIDFDTIRVATNDFSYENKLGEGGFGPVYKVLTYYCFIEINDLYFKKKN